MNRHKLKTYPAPFSYVFIEAKTAEFRYNDRNFQVGDVLILAEWVPPSAFKDGYFTGRTVERQVTHVQTGFGIPDGYAMLSLSSKIVHFTRP